MVLEIKQAPKISSVFLECIIGDESLFLFLLGDDPDTPLLGEEWSLEFSSLRNNRSFSRRRSLRLGALVAKIATIIIF